MSISTANSLKIYRWMDPIGGQGAMYPRKPELVLPCCAPLSSVLVFGCARASSEDTGGILKTSQWVNVEFGASGSSRIRTRLFVPTGIPSHATSGVSPAPLQVYTSGRTDPPTRESTRRVNAGDGFDAEVRLSGFTTGELAGEDDVGVVHPARKTKTLMITAAGISQRFCITGQLHTR